MAETKLSVVVTFFNKGKLLHNALESQFFHLYIKNPAPEGPDLV